MFLRYYIVGGFRKTINKKLHQRKVSIRHGSWLDGSNLSGPEIMKLTYHWSIGMPQVG
jgi:hypothetical protein